MRQNYAAWHKELEIPILEYRKSSRLEFSVYAHLLWQAFNVNYIIFRILREYFRIGSIWLLFNLNEKEKHLFGLFLSPNLFPSILSTVMETVVNRRIVKYLNVFRKEYWMGDLTTFLFEELLRSDHFFVESRVLALEIFKALNRVSYKALITKIYSFKLIPL